MTSNNIDVDVAVAVADHRSPYPTTQNRGKHGGITPLATAFTSLTFTLTAFTLTSLALLLASGVVYAQDGQGVGAKSIGKVQLATPQVGVSGVGSGVKGLQVAQSSYKGDTAMLEWHRNVVGSPEVADTQIIVDSNITYAKAIQGLPFSRNYTYANISLLNVLYISFDGRVHQGQILVHRSIAQEVYYFFMESYKYNFPIGKVVPLSAYGWSIPKAAKDGATFAITTTGSASDRNGFSMHINPLQNRGGLIPVEGVAHDNIALGAISSGGEPFMKGMKQLGWQWGGDSRGRGRNKSYARLFKAYP